MHRMAPLCEGTPKHQCALRCSGCRSLVISSNGGPRPLSSRLPHASYHNCKAWVCGVVYGEECPKDYCMHMHMRMRLFYHVPI
eukprot:1159017-Pelagomonas_calceolata.AAC.4